MATRIHSQFAFADNELLYLIDEDSGRLGLLLFPRALRDAVVRPSLAGGVTSQPPVDPLVQVSCAGDVALDGFSQGLTMRMSSTTLSLRFVRQDRQDHPGGVRVRTLLRGSNLEVAHILEWRAGEPGIRMGTELTPIGAREITLQMVTSFNLGHLTPFCADDAPERLRVHRFRSAWSEEGRHEALDIEALKLERSWSGHGVRCERFGQVGSLPVRHWFPTLAIEDTAAGVLWGAQLAWSGSWQMEVYRRNDTLSIGGGLADREFGHWMKRLKPGETFTTPEATLTCVQGDIDDLAARLTAMQTAAADSHPEAERELPITFNEYCTTWGKPTQATVERIASSLRGLGIRYFVIDAGWYAPPGGAWHNAHGDWVPAQHLFPQGLEAAARAIRERGMVPGLWFEAETVGSESRLWNRADLLLHRDGAPITSGPRRFLDLRREEVQDYLDEKIIALLARCGFGYVKIDYNETLGLGADGAESLGEGLRLNALGTQRFFRRLRERIPDLIIENCSSGGHRLEPAMLGLSAMSSFSDAHETLEIPIVAADVQRLILPRQSQVWAVLRAKDAPRRLIYSLAATFLGRVGLSGEIWELSDAQMATLKSSLDLYRRAVPTLRAGSSRRYGKPVRSIRHPQGWQAVLRRPDVEGPLLLVVHRFAGEGGEISMPIPAGRWRVGGSLAENGVRLDLGSRDFIVHGLENFAGAVFLLEAA